MDNAAVVSSSMRIVEGWGTRKTVPEPFSNLAAVEQYVSWVYAAATMNANAVASTPLRLYTRGRSSGSRFSTRAVSRANLRRMRGETAHHPSLGVVAKAQASGDVVEVDGSHPLIQLIHNGNPFVNGFDQTVLRMLYMELCGNTFVYPALDSSSGVPSELWLLPPQWVEIQPSLTEFIAGYWYGAEEPRRVFFARDEVIHVRRPNPTNVFWGRGKVEAGWWIVRQNKEIHEFDQGVYSNRARPDYLISIKGSPGRDQIERFESAVRTKLRGSRNAGNFLAVTGDVSVMPLAFPPKDLAGRDDVVEEIAAVFGVPVSLLKANDPNLASARVGYAQWREGTVLPLCRMDEQALNERLLPMFDLDPSETWLAYDNPVPQDDAANVSRWSSLVGRVLTANECRMEDGYEAIEGGDSLANAGWSGASSGDDGEDVDVAEEVPSGVLETTQETVLNGAQVTAASAIVAAVARGEIPRDSGIGQLEVLFNLSNEQAERIMGSAGTGSATTPNVVPGVESDAGDAWSSDDGEESRDGGSDDPGGGDVGGGEGDDDDSETRSVAVARGERGSGADGCGCGCGCGDTRRLIASVEWLKAAPTEQPDPSSAAAERVRAAMGRQAEAVRRLIEGAAGRVTMAQVMEVLLSEPFRADLSAALEEVVGPAMRSGARGGMSSLPASVRFDTMTNERVSEAARMRAGALAESIGRGTAERVVDAVARGIDDGRTVQDIAAGIEQAIGDESRALMVARTESASAYTAGEIMAWRESGVVVGKRWLLAPDPCEFCQSVAAEHGQGGRSVGLDESFYRVGHSLIGADGGVMVLDYADVHGPPLHPNCRCVLIPVLEGEE